MRKIYRKNKWLYKIRFSTFIINSWLLFHPAIKRQLNRKRIFYLSVLKALQANNKLVFDVGANEGFITDIFLKLKYTVVAIEPGEDNINILKSRFKNNKNIKIEPFALGKEEGTARIYTPLKQHALTTLSKKWKNIVESKQHKNYDEFTEEEKYIQITTLNKLIEKHGHPCYVKIDAEGYEYEIIKGLSYPLPLISFECILPEFYEETLDCLGALIFINPACVFNISINNEFIFTEFTGYEIMQEKISHLSNITAEIFAKT
ncbi:MAG: FkbM family methyltransferase [Ginsengibacter sp.]